MKALFLLPLALVSFGCAHGPQYCEDQGFGPIRGGPVYKHGKRCATGDPDKVKDDEIPEPTYWVRDCNGC